MQYRMIIRRTLFDFIRTTQGRLQLRSVKFLRQGFMEEKNNLLVVRDEDQVQFFVSGAIPVARLSREQVAFVAAAARFFGHLPDQDNLPVWLWADSLEVPRMATDALVAGRQPVYC